MMEMLWGYHFKLIWLLVCTQLYVIVDFQWIIILFPCRFRKKESVAKISEIFKEILRRFYSKFAWKMFLS